MSGRNAMPINALVGRGKKHLTKAEIESRLEAEEAIKPANDNVTCPTWLDPIGKKMWRDLTDELMSLELMTNVDVYALSIACDAYSKYVRASKDIKKDGLVLEHKNAIGAVNKVANPNVAIAQKYAQQFKSYCAEFGLSPAARARLAKPKDGGGDEDGDDGLD